MTQKALSVNREREILFEGFHEFCIKSEKEREVVMGEEKGEDKKEGNQREKSHTGLIGGTKPVKTQN